MEERDYHNSNTKIFNYKDNWRQYSKKNIKKTRRNRRSSKAVEDSLIKCLVFCVAAVIIKMNKIKITIGDLLSLNRGGNDNTKL